MGVRSTPRVEGILPGGDIADELLPEAPPSAPDDDDGLGEGFGSGADRAGGTADGIPERGTSTENVQGGRTDGLDVRPSPSSVPVSEGDLAAAQHEVLERVGPHSPELADVVVRLLADHVATDHRLNATEALLDADRRQRALQLLVEVAKAEVISRYVSLAEFLSENPGAGRLFAPVSWDINTTPEGVSRKKAFEAAARLRDPVRGLGPHPSPSELTLLDDYGIRLNRRVLPAARQEVAEIADLLGGRARVSARAKKVADLIDKVRRMTSDRPNRPARPDYRVGDIIDAVGVRLTLPDTETLALALDLVKERMGERILEIENMYAQPKAQAPSYRVIPLIISIETDGLPCTYELQLTTERASMAADIEHNTLYKPYVTTTDLQELAVQTAMEEAAALDQLEGLEQDDHGRQ